MMRIFRSGLLATGLSALLVAAPLSASAESSTAYTAYAEAQFLAGKNALGQVVDIIGDGIEEEGAASTYPEGGEQFTQSPLQALDQLTVPAGDALLDSEIGAVGSYAASGDGGSSRAASGAVTRDGIVHVGGESQPADSFATLNLSGGSLEPLTEYITDLRLELGVVSSSASLASPTAEVERDYSIAGSRLVLEIPALQALADGLGDGSTQLPGTLTIGSGPLCETLLGVLQLDPSACADLPSLGAVEISGLDTVSEGVEGTSDSGISFDLTSGSIVVELETLLNSIGVDINDLPENTDLLNTVLPAVAQRLPALIGEVVGTVEDLLTGLQITVTPPGGGAATPLPIDELTGPLADALGLFNEQFVSAFEQAAAPLADGLDTLTSELAQVAQVLVNVPDEYTALSNADTSQGEVHSISALRVKLFGLDGGEGQLADLLLANSLVGPNTALDVTIPQDPDPNDPNQRDENNAAPGWLPRTGVGLLAPVLFGGLAILGTGYLLTRRGKGDEAGPLGLG